MAKPLYGVGYSDSRKNTDAHQAATNISNSWMMHPAHAGAHQVHMWASHPTGVEDSAHLYRGTFDRVTPGVNKQGQKGVFASTAGMGHFIPNEAIHSLEVKKRPGEWGQDSDRAEKWNQANIRHNDINTPPAPGSQAALNWKASR
jgi:hypothetical protein